MGDTGFLRFIQPDPNYGKAELGSEVIVNVGQIVKIEPEWFTETPEGKRFLVYVGKPSEDDVMKGHRRVFRLYDSLGNRYFSEAATEESQRVIERLWNDTK